MQKYARIAEISTKVKEGYVHPAEPCEIYSETDWHLLHRPTRVMYLHTTRR